jgi:glycosyltransferase involved in cell wall biosynthesis
MKVALIARSTLYSVPGGDTVQATQTARHLNLLGVNAEVKLTNESIVYAKYDLLHFFNIIRPADILYHSERSAKPYVVSTILVDYSEYDKHHRKGIGVLFSLLPPDTIEYFKTVARWLLGRDHLSSVPYLWKGQRNSVFQILKHAKIVLPNSESEYGRLNKTYPAKVNYHVVPNGIDPQLFAYDCQIEKDDKMVLCVARIEGIKNQLNLIKGLNNSGFNVLLVGTYSPNQEGYYNECKQAAASNITFISHLPQHELVKYYAQAKVHVLPSWFETTGLSSVEAAAMGCNVVITDRGDAREYFGDDAFYCDPASPESILSAVKKASLAPFNDQLKTRILKNYTWSRAAGETLKAYQSAIAA